MTTSAFRVLPVVERLEDRRLLSTVTVPLTGAAFSKQLSTLYAAPPSGSVVLGSEQFVLSGNSLATKFPGAPSTATQKCSVTAPQNVRLLLNSSSTNTTYAGDTLATVKIGFGNGSNYSLPITIGGNVREWRPNSATVNTVTSSNSKKVFTGQATVAAGGPATAIMDMLTIPIPSAFQSLVLTSVSVTDDLATVQFSPGVLWMGLSVDGVPTPGSIAGKVFHDFNGDGKISSGEPALAGWTMLLDTNGNGKIDAGEKTTTSSADGTYKFTGLAPGTYHVTRIVKSGWLATAPSAKDVDIAVVSGAVITGKNFGVARPVAISGNIFNDINGDGFKDTNEASLSSWKVYVDWNNNGVLDSGDVIAITDSAGNFKISGLKPGTFSVRLIFVSGWSSTTPSAYSLSTQSGWTVAGIVFGIKH